MARFGSARGLMLCWRRIFRAGLLWLLSLGYGLALAQPAGLVASGPYRLDQLINLAVRAHPSVSSKRAGLNAAQADIEAARYQYYPAPSMQLRQIRGDVARVLTLQQPLWAGGRLDAGLDVASARSVAAAASIEEAQILLALRVSSAWQAWHQAQGRSAAIAAGIDLLNGYSQSAGRRIEAGAAGEGDRALVQARLAQSLADLASARAAERGALAQLTQMVGQPLRGEDLAITVSGGELKGPPSAASTPATEQLLGSLLEQALKVSPALRRAQAEIDAAGHEVVQKKAALWPTLNLRAEHQQGNTSNSSLTLNDNRLLLVLEYIPGAGLSAGAAINAASERNVGLRDNLQSTQRELIEKISAEFEDHQSSDSRQRDLAHALKASAEVLSSYDRLFIAGKRGWIDVLNAARELTQAQSALADVQALRLASATRLRLYVGEIIDQSSSVNPNPVAR